MNQETKTCQNCKNNFTIEPEDFNFYENIKVPPPTFCWECRLQRRMASRPISRAFYRFTCDLCKKDMISDYPREAPFPQYCSECWHSDRWDAMAYGRDYDFSKPFFQQWKELMNSVPRQVVKVRNSPGSRYCDGTTDCKNCFMLTGGYKCEDCMYGEQVLSKHSVDSEALNADHAYSCISASNIFRTKFSAFVADCIDCDFLFDCKGCTSCFGCVNLRNQQYKIFNKQYSKTKYREQMKYWDLGSYARLLEAKEKFESFKMTMPHRFAIMTNAINVVGNDILNAKNCDTCFMVKNGVSNCKYVYYAGLMMTDSYDVTAGGDISELFYETISSLQSQRLFFVNGTLAGHDMEYCEQVSSSSNMFGCIGMYHKQYCIFNKQYSREEYFAQVSKIKDHMSKMPYVDAKGRIYAYGEYFPIEMSPHAYNESWAFQLFPLTKDQIIEAGYVWQDRHQREYDIEIQSEELPDHVKDADASLANKVIACAHGGACQELCTSAFRIIPEELEFYKQMNIALPRFCPNCRFFQRFAQRNPPKLWHRKCAKCTNEFETSYAPDRKEIIYCQECYNAEFL